MFNKPLHSKILALASLSLCLVACGTKDAINATKSMPGEMQAMQSKMDETNAKMNETNRGIAKTSDGIHLQKLKLALDDVLKEENAEYLDKPLRMVPAGKTFAEEATADELAQLSYIWIKEVQQLGDDSLPQAQKDKLDMQKLTKVTALQVIASQVPASVVSQMINQQIYGEGPYERATMAFLALRANFIHGFLLGAQYLDGHEINNIGILSKAIEYADAIEVIVTAPFANAVKISFNDFANKDLNTDFAVDTSMAKDSWVRIAQAATAMAPNYSGQGSSNGESANGREDNIRKFNNLSDLVKQKQSEWSKR